MSCLNVLVLIGNAGQDLDENLYAGFGVFPSNLPEMRSLYYLAIDVQTVVGGQPLSALVQTSTYSTSPLPEIIGRDDAYYDISSKPRLTEVNNDGYVIKRSCGLPCRCSIWAKTRKRKQVGEEAEEDGEHGEDGEDGDRDEAKQPHQSAATDTSTNDHAGASVLTERNSFEGSDRQTQDRSCAQEHRIMLLTYKGSTGATY